MGAQMGILSRDPNRTFDSSDNILCRDGEKAAKAGTQRIQTTLEISIPWKVGIFLTGRWWFETPNGTSDPPGKTRDRSLIVRSR